MFDTYACKVRLSGNVLNEVPKFDLTAPEIEVLRALHGSDAVVDIKKTGSVKRTSADERQRLYATYATVGMAEQVKKKTTMIRELFGHDRLPLPETLEDPVEEVDEPVEAAPVEPAPPIRRTRAPKAEPSYTE